jgi:hypothetical protein
VSYLIVQASAEAGWLSRYVAGVGEQSNAGGSIAGLCFLQGNSVLSKGILSLGVANREVS